MAFRIDVRKLVPDPRQDIFTARFKELGLSHTSGKVRVLNSYIVDVGLTAAEHARAIQTLADNRVETASPHGVWVPQGFSYVLEIGFLPGVTDNVGATAREALEDSIGKKFKQGDAVYTSQLFFISGKISINESAISAALAEHPEVLAEAFQTILRREGSALPYEQLKALTQGKKVTLEILHTFISGLPVSLAVKKELMKLSPENYTGLAPLLAKPALRKRKKTA